MAPVKTNIIKKPRTLLNAPNLVLRVFVPYCACCLDETSDRWSRGTKTLGEGDTPHLRESGLWHPGNVCLWNPGIHQMLTCGIQNPRFWNPEYSSKNPVSSTGNPESTAWNPHFPSMARLLMPPMPQWNVEYKIRRAVDTFVFRVCLGPFINHIIRSPWP